MTENSISIIIGLIAIFLFLWLYIFLPAKMARKRGRSVIGWILIFWLTSPLCGIILLLILGSSHRKLRDDIIKEIHRKEMTEHHRN
jgi:energy-coupling factor transporter transmembrane protein EcfT